MRNDVIEEDLAKVCDCKPLSGVCVENKSKKQEQSQFRSGALLSWVVGGWSVKIRRKLEQQDVIKVSFPIPKCGCEKQPTLTLFFFFKAQLPLYSTALHAPRKGKQVLFNRAFIRCVYSVDMVNMTD